MSEPLFFQITLAFLGGLIVLILPCIFPTLFGYFVFITGVTTQGLEESPEKKTLRAFLTSLPFALGLSLIFALGTIPSPARSFLHSYYPFLAKVSGAIIIFFGLVFLKVLKLTLFSSEKPQSQGVFFGLVGVFLLGMAFGAAWTHCLDPILSRLLSLTSLRETVLRGSFLLTIYSLGMVTSLVLVGLLLSRLLAVFGWFRRYSQGITIASGVFLTAIGIMMVNTLLWVRLNKVFIGLTYNSWGHQLGRALLEFLER